MRSTTIKPTVGYAAGGEDLLAWTRRGIEILWLLTVFLVPLAFVSRGDLISASAIAYLEIPKIALLRTLVALMTILWLIEWAVVRGRGRIIFLAAGRDVGVRPRKLWTALVEWLRRRPERWLLLAVAAYLVTTLLSTVLSASFDVSMWGEVPGEDGYAAYTIITYVLLFSVIGTHLRTRSQVWRLMGALVVMGVLVAGYGILQHYGHDLMDLEYPQGINRATSTTGNPILAAAVLLMTILVSLTLAATTLRESWKRFGFWWKLGLWVSVLTVQFLGIYFTDSRGPWVGTTVALAGWLGAVLIIVGWRVFVRAALALGLAVIMTWAVLALPSSFGGDGAPAAQSTPSAVPEADDGDAQGNDGGGEISASSLTSELSGLLVSASSGITSRGLPGRIEMWKDSWRLMVHRPWFEFEDLSLSNLRTLIGYGPDLFRYVYMLESPPRGNDLLPRESVHAHNYFIHQGVEAGILGLLSSLGIFAALLLVGAFQLVRRGSEYALIHKLVLVGLLALMAGRFVEQQVGLARVSDLTVFWALLALLVALPVAMKSPEEGPKSPASRAGPHRGPERRPPPARGLFELHSLWRLVIVVSLVGGIGALTWTKTISYPRAAVTAAKGVAQSQDGDRRGALSSLGRAIDLAPDVWINYDRRAAIYLAYRTDASGPLEQGCGVEGDGLLYQQCLAEKAFLENQSGARQRPYNFRAKHALSVAALKLASLKDDKGVQETTLRSFRETAALVPAGWPLLNQLATAYLLAGQPEAALEPLAKSLAITGDQQPSTKAFVLRGIAYRALGRAETALKEFNRALQLSPGNLEAHSNRASVYWLLGQPQRAIEDLDQIIGFHTSDPKSVVNNRPAYVEAYSNRGLLYRDLGEPQRALEDLDQAIQLDPLYPEAYNNRGLVYSDLGEYQRAIEDHSEALRLDPGNTLAYINRGVAYAAAGRPEQALLDSEEAIRLEPQNARGFALRAVAHTLLGNEVEAGQDLERAATLGFDRASLEETIQDLMNNR